MKSARRAEPLQPLLAMRIGCAQAVSIVLGVLGAGCGSISAGPDGGDLGRSESAARACALDATYRYGPECGAPAWQVTLTPPASYTYHRVPYGTLPPEISCSPPLPACNTAAAIDVADLLRAIRDADVQRALAAASPPLYGYDTRPADGCVFQFLRDDGRGFLVGDACHAGACKEIPAGIARLVAKLDALDSQQLKHASCAGLP